MARGRHLTFQAIILVLFLTYFKLCVSICEYMDVSAGA